MDDDDDFTDADATLLAPAPWLVKIDTQQSQPYLFKFYASASTDRACVLITDTQRVWFEALNAKRLARRWRTLNPARAPPPFANDAQEHAFRTQTTATLSALHTPQSMQHPACVFAVEPSRDHDLTISLHTPHSTWHWTCTLLPARAGARILAAHLILPLLSVAHLAFASADPLSELEPRDLEQAVDRVGRTARRAQDVHVRQALARPRAVMAVARLTAVMHFVEELPAVVAAWDEEADDGEASVGAEAGAEAGTGAGDVAADAHADDDDVEMNPAPIAGPSTSTTKTPPPPPQAAPTHVQPDSATESESDAAPEAKVQKTPRRATPTPPPTPPPPPHARPSSSPSPSPPPRPAKKTKPNVVPDDTSDDDDAKVKVGSGAGSGSGAVGAATGAGTRKGAGVRQPLKRGGRRF